MSKKSLEGVSRKGKIIYSSDSVFSVRIRNQGDYFFNSSNAKIFSSPKKGSKVDCVHYGYRKNVSVPYKIQDLDGKIFYEE